MAIYLNVPYEVKDKARSYGARWDAACRQWFFPGTDADLPEWLRKFVPTAAALNTGPGGLRINHSTDAASLAGNDY